MVHETCVLCGAKSPQVASDFTLLGGAIGWRVARNKTGQGPGVEWYCPECWKKRKSGSGSVPPPARGR